MPICFDPPGPVLLLSVAVSSMPSVRYVFNEIVVPLATVAVVVVLLWLVRDFGPAMMGRLFG